MAFTFAAGTHDTNGATFTAGDEIFVEAGASVTSTSNRTVGAALNLQGGAGDNYALSISGAVSGFNTAGNVPSAIWFNCSSTSSHQLIVSATGSLYGEGGSVYMSDLNLLAALQNNGSITTDSSTVAAIFADGAGDSSWENFGLISSPNGNAIHFTKSGDHNIYNFGRISSVTIGTFAVISSDATAREIITNEGIIRGDMQLGGGNDSVDTQKGKIDGIVNLGGGIDNYLGFDNAQFSDNVSGDADNDTISGFAGNDNLDGGTGDDVINGGLGNDVLTGGLNTLTGDTLSYHGAVSGVTVSLAITTQQNTGGAGFDTIDGFENLVGAAFNDNLSGSTGLNLISGMLGQDTLFGGNDAVADTLSGGAGNDIYIVRSNDIINEFLVGDGTADRVRAEQSYTLDNFAHIEIMEVNSANSNALLSALNLTGNSLSQSISGALGVNILSGLGGVDTLYGGADAVVDTLIGGADNDIYIARSGDVITEVAGGGTADRVRAEQSFVLVSDDDIEIMECKNSTGNINLTGNDLTQSVTGNLGVNVLRGLGGIDTLYGGADNVVDTLRGDTENDVYIVRSNDLIIEVAGGGTADQVRAEQSFTLAADDHIEIMQTNNSALTTAINLTGNSLLVQSITGNAGANVLNGKSGNDTLNGLGGSDTFVFDTALNSTTNRDTIIGFVSNSGGQNDVIHLQNTGAGLFTALTTLGTLSINFFASNTVGRAMQADDRIIYETDTGKLFYDATGGNGSAATAADAIHFATLAGTPTISNLDFVVI